MVRNACKSKFMNMMLKTTDYGKRPNTKASINYKCEIIYEVRALVEVNDKWQLKKTINLNKVLPTPIYLDKCVLLKMQKCFSTF